MAYRWNRAAQRLDLVSSCAFGPTHRSNLVRSIRRALTWQFMYLPTAPWRWGRLKWVQRFAAPSLETLPEERRRLDRSPPSRSRGRPHPVASDNGMAHVRSRIFLHACHHRLVNSYRRRTLIPITFSDAVPGPSISQVFSKLAESPSIILTTHSIALRPSGACQRYQSPPQPPGPRRCGRLSALSAQPVTAGGCRARLLRDPNRMTNFGTSFDVEMGVARKDRTHGQTLTTR